MNSDSDSLYQYYVSDCLYCEPHRRISDLLRNDDNPALYKCMTCDRVDEKGVLINSRRSFLNNVG